MVDERGEEAGRDDVPSEDVDWIMVVFPELGHGVRTVVPHVDPFDQEFRQAGLGRVVEFGTYKNRTQWCIEIEVRRNDVPSRSRRPAECCAPRTSRLRPSSAISARTFQPRRAPESSGREIRPSEFKMPDA